MADPRRIAVACKARDLTDALAESVRQGVHAQLDELIAGSERCPYALTDAGHEAAQRCEARNG